MGDRRMLDSELTGVHVLVVDDDVDSRDILDAVLRYTGASVQSVPAAPVAVDRVPRHDRRRHRDAGRERI
jgi:CheY-like chemotaxis protein